MHATIDAERALSRHPEIATRILRKLGARTIAPAPEAVDWRYEYKSPLGTTRSRFLLLSLAGRTGPHSASYPLRTVHGDLPPEVLAMQADAESASPEATHVATIDYDDIDGTPIRGRVLAGYRRSNRPPVLLVIEDRHDTMGSIPRTTLLGVDHGLLRRQGGARQSLRSALGIAPEGRDFSHCGRAFTRLTSEEIRLITRNGPFRFAA